MRDAQYVNHGDPHGHGADQPDQPGLLPDGSQFSDDKGPDDKSDKIAARRTEEDPCPGLAAGKNGKTDDTKQNINDLTQGTQIATQQGAGQIDKKRLQGDGDGRQRDHDIGPHSRQRSEHGRISHPAQRRFFLRQCSPPDDIEYHKNGIAACDPYFIERSHLRKRSGWIPPGHPGESGNHPDRNRRLPPHAAGRPSGP